MINLRLLNDFHQKRCLYPAEQVLKLNVKRFIYCLKKCHLIVKKYGFER